MARRAGSVRAMEEWKLIAEMEMKRYSITNLVDKSESGEVFARSRAEAIEVYVATQDAEKYSLPEWEALRSNLLVDEVQDGNEEGEDERQRSH